MASSTFLKFSDRFLRWTDFGLSLDGILIRVRSTILLFQKQICNAEKAICCGKSSIVEGAIFLTEKGASMELKVVLKDLLRSKGISIAQLARATGVARQTIDNWVAGQEPRSLKQVKKIADYFGVSLDHLCFGQSPKDLSIQEYENEINAGVFEVVLRRVKRR